MRHCPKLIHAADIRHVAQNLRLLLTRPADRNVLQILQRLDRILGRLRHQVVTHTILRIEPERRLRLKTSAQRR